MELSRRDFVTLALAGPLVLRASSAWAGSAPVYAEDGIAIRGADTVAFFLGAGPLAGSVSEPVRWRGAIWLFATRRNRELFELDPRRYAPRFGGYCAYSLSQGGLVPSDPHAYAIHEGRLYLLQSVEKRRIWRDDLVRNIRLAERNWKVALG
jgi:hypothetical protein